MTEKGSKVLKGFLGLNSTERIDFIEELNRYQSAGVGSVQRQALESEVRQKASLGPKNSICDCCGR